MGKKIPNVATMGIAVLLLTGLVFSLPQTSAVHDDNFFELGPAQGADILGDGNAANGPDWADIFDANGDDIGLGAFGGIAASFVEDELSQKGAVDGTTFSGSNKNNYPISGAGNTWHWDSGNVPAKDDLSNVYAYATINPDDNHVIIFSGFERLDPSGDSHIDIEFFQDQVDLAEAEPCNDPGPDTTPCDFVGERTVGDVIVSMDFVVGGSIGTVSIREWNGVEYVLVEELVGEGCDATDTACAFNNGGLIDGGPWPNFNRFGDSITQLEQNSFTEFGFDVTGLLGETPCISTFMGKTRSSQSFTAELKDFSPPTAFDVCGASITIEPDDVNGVGQPHTFTVTVSKEVGNVVIPADDGTIVTVTLTDANGAVSSVSTDTCASPGTVNGTCDVTFTSNTAGTVTGHASADVEFNGHIFHVETDGSGNNSDDAVKRFVDAFITIAPDDVNSVGENHTFTVTVSQNVGLGDDFVSVPDGTIVNVTLTDANGAVSSVSTDTCASPGTSDGMCSVTFTSDTAGNVTGNASVTLTIDGVQLVRTTDGTGQNSGNAEKQFVSGTLTWTKVDNAGQLLGGATFEVCRTDNFNSDTLTFDPITPVCVVVEDNSPLDQDPDAGKFLLTGLVLGRYTVHETVAPPGFEADPDTVTVELTIESPNGTIAVAFDNQRAILKITEFGYTNIPTGTPTAGIVSGNTTYTAKVKNFGGATALMNISLTASIQGGVLANGTFEYVGSTGPASVSEPAAGSDCTAGCTAAWTGISVAPGAEVTITVTVEYSQVPDGTVIDADLASTYTTNGLTRTASGSPASITFTVQSD